jgi:hypothetical protein
MPNTVIEHIVKRAARGTRKAICLSSLALVGCGAVSHVETGKALSKTSTSGCVKRPSGATCYVLFLGNSYTYVNDLPRMFARLAESGHQPVVAVKEAGADETLAEHFESPVTAPALRAARWNVVVLQEESRIPSVERYRQTLMYPPARELVRLVDAIGAEPMFFVTPAHKEGWPEEGLDSYSTMQSAVDEGYRAIANETQAAMAPAGDAWAAVVRKGGGSGLWREDGSHPTVEGTYLSACVFYAAILRKSPEGLRYDAGLSEDEAAKLQAVASAVVLRAPKSGA